MIAAMLRRSIEQCYFSANLLRASLDELEMGPHSLAERGQIGFGRAAVEQWPAKFAFQPFDCVAQRGLRYAAAFRRAREVLFLADSQEIPNLVHLHEIGPHQTAANSLVPPCLASERRENFQTTLSFP